MYKPVIPKFRETRRTQALQTLINAFNWSGLADGSGSTSHQEDYDGVGVINFHRCGKLAWAKIIDGVLQAGYVYGERIL